MPLRLRPILLLACFLRCGLLLTAAWLAKDLSVFYAKDTASYLQPALEMLHDASFTTLGEPEIIRTPGYPLLLCIGAIFQHVEIITILLQIGLSCLTVWLIYRIALLLFADEKSALQSAFLCSLEPLSIIYSCWLLSDTLFVALLALTMWTLLLWCRQRKLMPLLASALALSAAVYVRPIGYVIPFVCACALSWQLMRSGNNRRVSHFVLWALSLMLLLGAWHVRNIWATGYSGFSAATDFNLYFHQVASLQSEQQNRPFYEMLDELGFYETEKYFAQHPEQRNWPVADRYQFMRDEGVKAMLRDPLNAAQIYAKGIFIVVSDPGVFDFLRLFRLYPKTGKTMNTILTNGVLATALNFVLTNPLIAFWALLLGALLFSYYSLALIGLWPQLQTKSLPLAILLTTSLSLILLAGGTIGAGRFRLPAMIAICVLGGRGLSIASAQTSLLRERFVTALYETAVGFGILSKR